MMNEQIFRYGSMSAVGYGVVWWEINSLRYPYKNWCTFSEYCVAILRYC